MDKHLLALKQIIKTGIVKENVDLKELTTIKIGGLARFFVQTNQVDELKKLLKYTYQNNLAIFVLGGGSNVIFSDSGFNGIIIKLTADSFKIISSLEKIVIEFGAGYPSSLAATKTAELGYSGFECLSGLPGTIGGAIYQNSKWPKDNYQISDNLLSVSYLDKNAILVTKTREELKFAYGYSQFQDFSATIISARFIFRKKSPQLIKKRMKEVMAYRLLTQPHGVYTAGCVFKNINEQSAGYLLDKSGLKETTFGQMTVSKKHANFFINQGSASSKDYLSLVEKAKQLVKAQFNLDLKEEVQFVQ